ncbi:alpha/beta hydrolase [Streptomyces thinghirensis]|nr:alpha/beta hydrolase [Streptomyces thinghirensis]
MLALAYRGDVGARAPRRDGLHHFGETEWRDLDAAVRYAVDHGARQVVLLGWSTGATMALRTAALSGVRERIARLIPDSPVLSWEATLRALATARRTPGALLPLAVRAAQGRAGLHADSDVHTAGLHRPAVPTLIFHGPDDLVAPWALSRLPRRHPPAPGRPPPVEGAPHGAM